MTLKKSIYSIALATLIMIGCKTTPPVQTTTTTPPKPVLDCGTTVLTFAGDIKPILDQHCNKCHRDRSPGGYNFSTYENTVKAAGDKEFLGSIKWEGYYDHMPAMAAKLDDATIKKIECWVNTGMK
ncbi:MAG TPA: hypothetical protein PLL00_03390 [Bacteroidia bacterium]|jgi:hypothetical protein|nr:hypothetical protein [Bacteroidia bacterium]